MCMYVHNVCMCACMYDIYVRTYVHNECVYVCVYVHIYVHMVGTCMYA